MKLEGIREKLAVGLIGLAGLVSSLPGCAFRQGDECVRVFMIPGVPVVSTSRETYESPDSNVVKDREEITMSSWFGNIYLEVKRWEGGKYVGMQKVKIENNWGEYRACTETYDQNNKLIDKQEGAPVDLPNGLHIDGR